MSETEKMQQLITLLVKCQPLSHSWLDSNQLTNPPSASCTVLISSSYSVPDICLKALYKKTQVHAFHLILVFIQCVSFQFIILVKVSYLRKTNRLHWLIDLQLLKKNSRYWKDSFKLQMYYTKQVWAAQFVLLIRTHYWSMHDAVVGQ